MEEVPYKPYESPEEKAMGVNYSLAGRWVITADVMQDANGMGADRWAFKADTLPIADISGTISTTETAAVIKRSPPSAAM